jgi:hypothetical protein
MTLPISTDPQRWGGVHKVYDKASGGGDIDKSADFVPPYVSTKHEPPTVNNNGKYKVSGLLIVCRHLVTKYILNIFYNDKAKVIADEFSGDEIPLRMDPGIEDVMSTLYRHSPHISLIKNDSFGQELADMFAEMGDTPGTVRAAMLFNANHVMGIKLHVKLGEDGCQKRVVTFYDPNSTGTWVRTAEKILPDSTEPSEISKLTTKNFLGEDRDWEYFGDSNTSALVPVDKALLDSIKAGTFDSGKSATAKLAKCDFDQYTINKVHIFQMMQFHLHESLADLLPMFESFPMSKKINLLSAEFGGRSALAELMLFPCEKTLEAYKNLFNLLPPDEQSVLIFNAAQDLIDDRFDESASISAERVKNLVTLIPNKRQKKFMSELIENVIGAALASNNPKAIDTCCKLLQSVAEKNGEIILMGVIENGLQEEDADAMRAFGTLLKSIPEGDARFNLINTMTKNGIGKFLNLERSKPEVVAEKVKLLELVSPGHRMALCVPKYALHLSELFKEFNAAPEKNKAAFMSVLVGTFDKLDASQKFQMLKVFDKLNLSDQFIEANVSASGMHSGDEVFLHAST